MSFFGPCKKKYIDKYSYMASNVLGQGYSGIVYLGKNQQTGKLCAIKIIEKSILKYQAHKSMILCQIEFLSLLKSCQKILTLYDVYKTKNNVYLVLELCNTDLKQYIKSKKMISEPQAIDIMNNIIEGYKQIWKAKIVHRDLKPSNILLQDNKIKIADFGFSMFEKDKIEFQKINVGSPYYMPLQVLAYNSYSYQSDIWALGVIYFQMLTGHLPWKAKTQRQLYLEIKAFEIQKIMPKNISQKSIEFLTKTLTIDVNKRMKPQEIISFQFQGLSLSVQDSLRISHRSIQAQSLSKSTRISQIIRNPEDLKTQQNKNQQNQVDEQINIAYTGESKDDLAKTRMQKKNNSENFDEVKQLPSSPKKKKSNVNRKTSLQTQCEIFQIQKLNQMPNSSDKLQSKFILPNKQLISKKNDSKEELELPTKTIKKESNQFEPKQDQNLKLKPKKQSNNNKLDQESKQKRQQIMKKFSKLLRSQIHFCRYIFKLLLRVIQNIPDQLKLVKPELKQQMAAFIFLKLKTIQSHKLPDSSIYQEWLQTKQWDKIKTVIKQYKSKYLMTLKDVQVSKQFDNQLFKKLLKKGILNLYQRAYDAYIAEQERQQKDSKTKLKRAQSQKSTQIQEDEESQLMKIKQEILILDYFITLKQLHKLQQKYGWQVFEQKSKIQGIVEGQPLKYIQKKHILAISSKLQTLKML